MGYRIQRKTVSVGIADGQTVGTGTVVLNGRLLGVLTNPPDLTGTTTITVAVEDEDSYTVFSKASIAENAKTATYLDANNHPLRLPVAGSHTVRVTASNSQSGAKTIPVVLLIDRG